MAGTPGMQKRNSALAAARHCIAQYSSKRLAFCAWVTCPIVYFCEASPDLYEGQRNDAGTEFSR
jgi:hypothetical protein